MNRATRKTRALANARSHRRAAPNGFSLVELLVVTGVIGLLSALLLPSLERARACARRARCQSNLRQLSLATQLYADDHGGSAFAERSVRTNGGWVYWFGWLGDGAEGQRDFDASAGVLWPYLSTGAIADCPGLQHGSWLKPKARGGASGYGYNLLLGPRNQSPLNWSRIPAPGRLAAFADCAQINDFLAPASIDRPLLEEFYYFETNAAQATVHFRHASRAQVAFGDGHVGAETMAHGSLDCRLPQQQVGRLEMDRVVPQ